MWDLQIAVINRVWRIQSHTTSTKLARIEGFDLITFTNIFTRVFNGYAAAIAFWLSTPFIRVCFPKVLLCGHKYCPYTNPPRVLRLLNHIKRQPRGWFWWALLYSILVDPHAAGDHLRHIICVFVLFDLIHNTKWLSGQW